MALVVRGIGVVILAAIVAWPMIAARQSAQPAGQVLMISGRDDHGLLAEPVVRLYSQAGASAVVGGVRDGSFVQVLEQQGDWMRVEQLGMPNTRGWVNDYYLRHQALRRDGGGQVVFASARVKDGQLQIAVRPAADPAAAPIWLAAEQLGEIGARGNQP